MPSGNKQDQTHRRPIKREHVRVKRYSLSFGFVVTLRRFKTNKNRRSKRIKQSVLPFQLFGYKEIAVALVKPKHRPSPTLFWLPRGIAKALIVAALVLNTVSLAVLLDKGSATSGLTPIPAPAATVYQPIPTAKVMPKSKPLKIRIPAAAVNTSIISLGRRSDSTIELPQRFDIVGWYKYGPTPGELGPAVIVGHVDSYKGLAVFWHLHELKPKDVIEVERADGTVAKFSVTKVKEVPQNKFPTKEIYGKINYAGIRLVTCGGVFNHKIHRYSHNTVVYGRLI